MHAQGDGRQSRPHRLDDTLRVRIDRRRGIDHPVRAAVADKLDDARKWVLSLVGKEQPTLDRLPSVAVKGNVIRVDGLETIVDGLKDSAQVECPRFLQSLSPEIVKVVWLLACRLVGAQLFQGHVKKHRLVLL